MAERIGQYEILAETGRGLMGRAYKARDSVAGHIVTIETIDYMQKDFLRAARAVRGIRHDHIVAVYECFDGATPYVVSEFVDGELLEAKLKRNRLPRIEALRILNEVAGALDYAHSAGLTHCGVRPGNLIITRTGSAKLANLEFVDVWGQEDRPASEYELWYLPPEAISGKCSAKADQYSLAVTAFHLLTGSVPFGGKDAGRLVYSILNDPAPKPTSVDSGLPHAIDEVLLKALSKEPDGRYKTCTEFVTRLQHVFGLRIGRYEIIRTIARGGMGVVSLANDPKLGRHVAIKAIHMSEADEKLASEFRARFAREAKAAGTLQHPNIAAVYDSLEVGDDSYIVMEFVDGPSLQRRIDDGGLSIEESLRVLRDTALALDYAHSKGVVHRDIKPLNVLISSRGEVKLVDFGIAKVAGDQTITAAGAVPGTKRFMAPERLEGEAGPATDQWALGVMAYRMLTGEEAFRGDDEWQLLGRILYSEPVKPSAVNAAVPSKADAILLRALAKKPEDRYPTCAAFVAALQQAIAVDKGAPAVKPPVAQPAPGREEAIVAPAVIAKKVAQPLEGEIRENPKDGLQYVWIPPGSFWMGASPADTEAFEEEKPRHLVNLTRGFWIGQTPVTAAAWKRFVGDSSRKMPDAPSFNRGWAIERQPMVNVSWSDAQEYCKWAGLRLPTEAEWEYAARAGCEEARYGSLDEIAWHSGNSDRAAHEVGLKLGNEFGLYEVLGNVWEWVADWYGPYKGAESSDPQGPASGESRALRGGSWKAHPRVVRASFRSRYEPTFRNYDIGFRCAGELR